MASSTDPSNPFSSSPSEEGRNLVLSIDGTANEFSFQNTNVVELCRILIKDETQLAYYTSGIGTFAHPDNTIFGKMEESFETILEMVTARHFEQKIFAAYQWLSENYKHGDKIYLFGFSRGAYFVRVIAGMIKTVGLLHKGNNDQIPFAFKLYSRSQEEHVCTVDGTGSNSQSNVDSAISNEELCARYKDAFSHEDAKVHFVGAWDTVSSVGLVRKACLPETIGMNHVKYFRHALALDEWRVKFVPEYAHRCEAQPMEQSEEDLNHSTRERIKEVWFRGFHADIGGANNTSDNDRPSLRWMISEAQECGLRFQPGKLPKQGIKPSTYTNPATWYWKLLEWLPIRRVTHGSGTSPRQEFTRTWHKGRSRTIRSGHYIHTSVEEAMKTGYKPKARLCVEGQSEDTPHEHQVIKNISQISLRWIEDAELARRTLSD